MSRQHPEPPRISAVLVALLATSLFFSGAVAEAAGPSADALQPPPGWEVQEPKSPETALSLKKGDAAVVFSPVPESELGLGLRDLLARDRTRLLQKGKPVGAIEEFEASAGPVLYAGFRHPAGQTSFGYFALGKKRYSFLAENLPEDALAAIVDHLAAPSIAAAKLALLPPRPAKDPERSSSPLVHPHAATAPRRDAQFSGSARALLLAAAAACGLVGAFLLKKK